jgi:hypothetical protein
MSDWIMTASGRRFWPLAPCVEDVSIVDIAHHLGHLCRFTGAVRTFYSVAQHSVLVSFALAIDHRESGSCGSMTVETAGLYGLLHDASEAYLMDVPRPLKRDPQFAPYREAEARLQAVIYRAFDLDPAGEPAVLKAIDRRALRTEQRDLMPDPGEGERRDDVVPFRTSLREPDYPSIARLKFLARFIELTGWQPPTVADALAVSAARRPVGGR